MNKVGRHLKSHNDLFRNLFSIIKGVKCIIKIIEILLTRYIHTFKV